MNRERLLANARNNPRGLRFPEVCALAEAFGFQLIRQRGSHRMFARSGVPIQPNLQPDKNGMAKEYQVRDLLTLIDDYGE